jgi:Glu-tRNA(Gln) amidotransferase subunit E-like FAD-binding protein
MSNSQVHDSLRQTLDATELRTIQDFLRVGIISEGWYRIELPHSDSHIIQQNNGELFCTRYRKLKGLFVKGESRPATTKFGRIICDTVIEIMQAKGFHANKGFLTSDELPGYHISKRELNKIRRDSNAESSDLVVIFAYDAPQALKTKECLDELLHNVYRHLSKSRPVAPIGS